MEVDDDITTWPWYKLHDIYMMYVDMPKMQVRYPDDWNAVKAEHNRRTEK